MSRVFDDAPEPPRRREPPEPGQPHLKPAGPRLVVLGIIGGLLLGWLVVSLFTLVASSLPVTPWSMSILLVVMAAAAVIGSMWLRRRLDDPAGRTDFEVPLAALVLGRSMLVTGLLLAGAHVSYVIAQLGRLDVALYRERAIAGAAAVVAGAVFALGGYLLERACRVDAGTDDSDDPPHSNNSRTSGEMS